MLTPIAGEMAGKEMASQQAWDLHSMRKAARSLELSFSFSLVQILPIRLVPVKSCFGRRRQKERVKKKRKQHTISPILPSKFSSLVYFPYEVSAASIPTSAFSVGHSRLSHYRVSKQLQARRRFFIPGGSQPWVSALSVNPTGCRERGLDRR